jgi:hypothetical protein
VFLECYKGCIGIDLAVSKCINGRRKVVMFEKIASNKGFNKFAGIAKKFFGWGELGAAGANIKGGMGQLNYAARGKAGTFQNQVFAAGGQQLGGGMRQLGAWATGGFAGGGGARVGRAAGRIGGTAFGVGATADFLNPWGLGWGD